MTAEIVQMVAPREITSNIGRHKLYLRFVPNAPINERWSWLLKVTRVFEYTGACETPGLCRLDASKFVSFHENLENLYGR